MKASKNFSQDSQYLGPKFETRSSSFASRYKVQSICALTMWLETYALTTSAKMNGSKCMRKMFNDFQVKHM
jgi:hypothetical protein